MAQTCWRPRGRVGFRVSLIKWPLLLPERFLCPPWCCLHPWTASFMVAKWLQEFLASHPHSRPCRRRKRESFFPWSCQQSLLQSLGSKLGHVFILRQERILPMSLYAPIHPTPRESTSSKVHGKCREGGYPKENVVPVVTRRGWMLRTTPPCPLQYLPGPPPFKPHPVTSCSQTCSVLQCF